MELTRAADVSMYGGLVTTEQWVAAKKDHGIGLAIVGSWHGRVSNPYCEETLTNAVAAGLRIATYAALNSRSGEDTVWFAAAACGEHWPDLAFVALDIEIDGVTEQVVKDAEASVTAGNLRPIIYTGRWFWSGHRHLGNPTWACYLPLWDSHYDGLEELVLSPTYGGWTTQDLVGKQYLGSNNALGFSCDLSVFEAAYLTISPECPSGFQPPNAR